MASDRCKTCGQSLCTVLGLFPHPEDVHRRLGEVSREARLLRRQLRLSLAAVKEEAKRKTEGEA